jgi:hypothetical protein
MQRSPCLLFSSLSNLNFRNLKSNADPVYYEGSTFTTQKLKNNNTTEGKSWERTRNHGKFYEPFKVKKGLAFHGPNSEKIITTKRKSRAIHVPYEEKK